MPQPDPLPEDNPFSTRRIRPGALRFLFPPGESVEQLIARLEENRGWGQIIGPHGSGKSALLATLIPALKAAGWHVVLFTLHDGQRKLPPPLPQLPECDPPRLLAVDGYEQLARWERLKIRRLCRKHAWGLLVTAHGPVNLPDLYRLEPTPALARRVVDELTGPRQNIVPEELLKRLYAEHRGDLRELLFSLYDHYEQLCKAATIGRGQE
ncbi:MAG: hypothetical protein JXB10_04970 [Pirellulales bacterium]|nr:hypothetical protein [Pirellulales bacterium]